MQNKLADIMCPYGGGNASPQIKEVLKTWNLGKAPRKPFYDFPISTRE